MQAFAQLREHAGTIDVRLKGCWKLRHDEMIIGVEPLRHFERRCLDRTTSHREVRRERPVGPVTRRDRAEGERGVQDVIVERKTRGNPFDTRRALDGVRRLADRTCGHVHGVFADAPGPIGFECDFEFPAPAHARIAEISGNSHRNSPCQRRRCRLHLI